MFILLCSYVIFSCALGSTCTGGKCKTSEKSVPQLKMIPARSPCESFPCQHGGTCQPLYETNDYSCFCIKYYTGKNCEKCPCHGKADGKYKDPNNCYGFIICLNSLAYYMDCPAGLKYNAETDQCDLPQNAKC
ncbi:hypothetical protein OS493_038152 [Desmophyllum pertusum]|uniref:Uncharacterized protein n=1 Tax=Desmophyllum pertusum TaxID=174260 RepID=A0A9W9Z7N2_9CNID|nr:hypothetical protein OS493_038152 [Desmophyllum pertusum]